MADPKSLKTFTLRTPDFTDIIPGMRPGDTEARGFTPPQLFGLQVTGHATNAPTVNDDETNGHIAPMFWVRLSPFEIYFCSDATDGAAVWTDITSAASVTGLANPLVAALDADGYLIHSAPFSGFRDRYYDLEDDSGSLITAGVCQLVASHNAYAHADLDEALEVRFPDPASVAAGDALFGIISVRLGSGGSVSLAQTYPWVWERADPLETTPVIPSDIGSHFRVRYQYDPVAEVYAVTLGHMDSAPASSSAVTYVPGSVSVSDLSLANKDTHTHTHPLTSTAQDGTSYLIVGFFADGTAAPTSVPGDLTAINTPPTGAGTQIQNWWYWYKFDTDDLTAEEVELSFGKANEMAQVVAFEVTGAHATTPVGNLAFDRSSSTSRTAIGPTTLPAADGSLLVTSVGMDMSSGTKPTIAVNAANSFTEIANYISATDGMPTLRVLIREVEDQDDYDTPSFTRSAEGSAAVQLEAFTLVPNS
jgi:hypothetical protein